RRRKPLAEHLLNGTFRADRHGEIDEPEPPKGRPEPPYALPGHAKAEWDRMVARLEAAKTLSVIDDGALYEYAQLFAEKEAAVEAIAQLVALTQQLTRVAIERLKGDELADSIAKIVELEKVIERRQTKLRQSHLALKVFLVEFGLTTTSRSRVRPLA